MLANRLTWGACLGIGVLAASIGGAAARAPGGGPAGFVPAEFPSFESFAASISSSIPRVLFTMRVAQNASERKTTADIPNTVPNTANVSLQMSPDQSVSVGTKISFRVTTRKPGYLLLVDIDANGNMSQIFPSPEMIVQSQEAATNFIKPGEELLIPNSAAKKRGFEYVITPPIGEAAVVAILSDRRVQILDLPDDARKPRTEAETIGYLTGWTSELRVPDPDTGKLQPSNWSFDIKPYSIR
jgi:Domain of unknown function (DUF4384)